MTGVADMLTPREARAIEALLAGAGLDGAAAAAGVGLRTFRRWRARETFRRALSAASAAAIEDAATALAGANSVAVQVLRDVASDVEAPEAVRVAAARAILEATLRMREAVEIEHRLAALEERMTVRFAAEFAHEPH